MDLQGYKEAVVSRSVKDFVEEMLNSIENDQNEESFDRSEIKGREENTVEKTIGVKNNEDKINEEKNVKKIHSGKNDEMPKNPENNCRSLKRKMDECMDDYKLQLSSSSEESIIIIGHRINSFSPNRASIFSDTSPISFCNAHNTDDVGNNMLINVSPKNKCQRFKKHDDTLSMFVVKPMIGPQLPHAGPQNAIIICPPVKFACSEMETFCEKTRRMRRTEMRKEVEMLVAEKLQLQKSLMQRRRELLTGSNTIKDSKARLEKKVIEVRLLSVECMRSVSKALEVVGRLKNLSATDNTDLNQC